jgi:KDO2-lipid IV(A) lauroyltransferase
MGFPASIKRGRRRLTFLVVRTFLRMLGFSRAYTFGSWLGELQFFFDGRTRRRLQADVAVALGRAQDDPSVPALLRESYRVNNGAVLEIMSLLDRRQSEAELVARCEIDGLENLRAAMTEGRGAILLATHMGNVALATVRLTAAGWPVSVVYRDARMMSDEFFQSGLEQYGVQGILANAGIQAYGQMLSALKQGRVVQVMLDQGVKRAKDGLVQRFMGKDVPMPAGPAQLARSSRAPVLPLVMTGSSPHWRFEIQPAVRLSGGSLESDVALLVDLTGRQILQSPQFWSWHHRRWRKFALAAPGSS